MSQLDRVIPQDQADRPRKVHFRREEMPQPYSNYLTAERSDFHNQLMDRLNVRFERNPDNAPDTRPNPEAKSKTPGLDKEIIKERADVLAKNIRNFDSSDLKGPKIYQKDTWKRELQTIAPERPENFITVAPDTPSWTERVSGALSSAASTVGGFFGKLFGKK